MTGKLAGNWEGNRSNYPIIFGYPIIFRLIPNRFTALQIILVFFRTELRIYITRKSKQYSTSLKYIFFDGEMGTAFFVQEMGTNRVWGRILLMVGEARFACENFASRARSSHSPSQVGPLTPHNQIEAIPPNCQRRS